MNNLTARTAHADQVAADVRDSRCCDALTPCTTCTSKAREVHSIRHAARIEALAITRPATTALRARLARTR